MLTIMVLLAIGALLELGMHIRRGLWRHRVAFAIVAIALTAFASGAFVLWAGNIWGVAILLLSMYRILSLFRIFERRMHERHMHRGTLYTSISLISLQLLVGVSWLVWQEWQLSGHTYWVILAALQFVAAGISLWSVVRNMYTTAWPPRVTHYSDEELPPITVAIPARNETDDLQECLRSVIANDYPKLEVLVFDDCSQTPRTPEIIRSFAQDGVRFLQGEEPSANWLPKNRAYDQLIREASGTYVLFCGVDVRFSHNSLRQIVGTMLDRNKQMMSIIPQRTPEAYRRFSLLQAMRYWWELVPLRRMFRRPPVLSSCWIIERTALYDAGGFKAVARSIIPEAFFARRVARMTDGYSFLRAGKREGIQSVKTTQQQLQTAVRVRYPQVHRQPEQVAVHSFLEAVFLLLPFVLAIGGFWLPIGAVAQSLAALASVALIITHLVVVLSTRVNTWWFGVVAMPFMVLVDIFVLHYSLWRYEFSEVIWKGRNVCVPALHVFTRLPRA